MVEKPKIDEATANYIIRLIYEYGDELDPIEQHEAEYEIGFLIEHIRFKCFGEE